jgi:hypothetical protein
MVRYLVARWRFEVAKERESEVERGENETHRERGIDCSLMGLIKRKTEKERCTQQSHREEARGRRGRRGGEKERTKGG